MFRHKMCHPQGACFVTLINYIRKIAAPVKINKFIYYLLILTGASVVLM